MDQPAGSDGSKPGRLVLVVGPSGAGKDSLIRHARSRLAGRGGWAFPRRIVTREPSEAEDNIVVDPDTFAAMLGAGELMAAWSAHGLSYGIPAEAERLLAEGRNVVCNVSRTVVETLRGRQADVRVVEVTAPPAVLAQRLAARAREAGGGAEKRLARSDAVRVEADLTIVNDGPLEAACEAFLLALTSEAGRTGASPPAREPTADARPPS